MNEHEYLSNLLYFKWLCLTKHAYVQQWLPCTFQSKLVKVTTIAIVLWFKSIHSLIDRGLHTSTPNRE